MICPNANDCEVAAKCYHGKEHEFSMACVRSCGAEKQVGCVTAFGLRYGEMSQRKDRFRREEDRQKRLRLPN